jgi:hypothetical protein
MATTLVAEGRSPQPIVPISDLPAAGRTGEFGAKGGLPAEVLSHSLALGLAAEVGNFR